MIGSRKKLQQFHKTGLQLYIGNEPVKEVFSCKYLGVILDPCLNWKLHVDHIRSKIIRNYSFSVKQGHTWIVAPQNDIFFNNSVTFWLLLCNME